MADVIYTTVPGKIKALLGKIKEVGVPPKVTVAWLKSIGFTSSNDKSLIGVLKLARLIDDSGAPTPNWQKFRGPKGGQILAGGIMEGYSALYAVYPDAHSRSNGELEHVFNTSTKAGKQSIQKAVGTFKNLVGEADFSDVAVNGQGEELHIETGELHVPVSKGKPHKEIVSAGASPSLHIDIQIHISSEASAEQIDQIFASMSKHLYGRS